MKMEKESLNIKMKPYFLVTGYLDEFRKGLETGGEAKEGVLQFWQYFTVQDFEVYTDEEIALYEKNLRTFIEEKGEGITADEVIGLIHERDVESVMYPDRETFTQRTGKLIRAVLEDMDFVYKEYQYIFDEILFVSDTEVYGKLCRLSVKAVRPQKNITIRLTLPFESAEVLTMDKCEIYGRNTVVMHEDDGSVYTEHTMSVRDCDENVISENVKTVVSALIISIYEKKGV